MPRCSSASASTALVISILARWMKDDFRNGRLRDDGQRSSGAQLLRMICAQAGHADSPLLFLHHDPAPSMPDYPAPTAGQLPFTLKLDTFGDIQLSDKPLPRASTLNLWVGDLDIQDGRPHHMVPILAKLATMGTKHRHHFMFRQIVKEIARLVEERLWRCGDPAVARYDDHSEGPYRSRDKKIEYRLCLHQRAGRSASADAQFLSLATDKGRIGVEGLQLSVLALPSNEAILSQPVVTGSFRN